MRIKLSWENNWGHRHRNGGWVKLSHMKAGNASWAPYNFANFATARRVSDGNGIRGTGIRVAAAGLAPVLLVASNSWAHK